MPETRDAPEPFRYGPFDGYQLVIEGHEVPTWVKDKNAIEFHKRRTKKYKMTMDQVSKKTQITTEILWKLDTGEYQAPGSWWVAFWKLMDVS